MTPQSPQRKKIYLGWKLHGRIVAQFALYWLVYHVVVMQGLCGREFLMYGTAALNGKQQIPFDEFLYSLARQHVWLIVVAVAAFPLILWEIVRLTHRFVGPMKQLESELRRMAKGEAVRTIRFREGDFAEGVEEAFNEYVASRHAASTNVAATAACESVNARPDAPATAVGARQESFCLGGDELASLFHGSPIEKLNENVKSVLD
jgi:methyl-accepting chemotaxis protein